MSFFYRDVLTTYRVTSLSKNQLLSIHGNDINLIEITSFINLIETTSFINQKIIIVDELKYAFENDEDMNTNKDVVIKNTISRQTLKKKELMKKLYHKLRKRQYKTTLILTFV